jgi:hypothetical protein
LVVVPVLYSLTVRKEKSTVAHEISAQAYATPEPIAK